MSWQDIIKEDNISKIKLPFGKGANKRANAQVISIFQEEIGKATTVADLVKAMEQFANQPSAQQIWDSSDAKNPLGGALQYAQQAIDSAKLSSSSELRMISAGYQDDRLDGDER